jgi:hypothetical protein
VISSATPSARSPSIAWVVPGHQCRLLERRLHRAERPVLDSRLAGMVELVAELPIGNKRTPTWLNIKTSLRGCRSASRLPRRRAAQGRICPDSASRSSTTGSGKIGDAQIGPIYLGWAGIASLIFGFIAIEIIGFNMPPR